MPQDAQITFVSQTLPEGVCPINEQERFNLYAAFLSGFLPGNFSSFNLGNSQPTVDNQDKPWIRTNADGTFDAIYVFANGAWLSPYPTAAGPNGVRWLYADTEVSLETFDGGSAGAVTSTTGPFWQADHDWDDKLPRGVGTVALNTNANELSSGASITDQVRGVFYIKRTARIFRVA